MSNQPLAFCLSSIIVLGLSEKHQIFSLYGQRVVLI